MKKLLIGILFILNAGYSIGQEDGLSCETAYNANPGNNVNLLMQEEQIGLNIVFTATSNDIAIDMYEGTGNLDVFETYTLFELEEGCATQSTITTSNLTRYFENNSTPFYSFQLNSLSINSTYLLVVKRNEAFDLLDNDVGFNSIFFATSNCTSQSGCNLVRNGKFEDFNVSAPSNASQFIHARDQVCWWKEYSNHNDADVGIVTGGKNYASSLSFQKINEAYGQSEAIVSENYLNFSSNSDYIASFKVKKRQALGPSILSFPSPDEFICTLFDLTAFMPAMQSQNLKTFAGH